MQLENLGYNHIFDVCRKEQNLGGFEIGRVVEEHKERYVVKTQQGEFEAEITGNLRFSAQSREDFPAVGDWVALTILDQLAVVHKVLPRYSVIKRQLVGNVTDVQVIAANVDFAFLVQAVDRDFSINRFERYLTICNASKVSPVIILTKTDLISPEQLSDLESKVKQRIQKTPVYAISNQTLEGYEAVKRIFEKGKTYCMLGSSGVGKSTLLNILSGKEIMKTDVISQSSQRGKHVTSHRELIVLENGGILIDNPGMREVGIADATGGLETTFDDIVTLAAHCKYKDCSHTSEKGCAVLAALTNGTINSEAYQNFMKMEKERAHFESTVEERKRKDKRLGKVIKNYKKDMGKGPERY